MPRRQKKKVLWGFEPGKNYNPPNPPVAGGLVVAEEKFHKVEGQGAVTFTLNRNGSQGSSVAGFPGPLDLTRYKGFEIWRRVAAEGGGNYQLWFRWNAPDVNNSFLWVVENQITGAPNFRFNDQRYFKLMKNDAQIIGTPDWKNVINFYIQIFGLGAVNPISITLDDLRDATPHDVRTEQVPEGKPFYYH